jgi:AAA+ ATPase superfamily predicted ATPase
MREFHDRTLEMKALRDRLARRSSFSLVYGQRRVGKTCLLQKLLEDRAGAVFFMADESTPQALLHRFHDEVAHSGVPGAAWSEVTPSDWGTALTLLVRSAQAEGQKLVLVLDEVQYLLQRDPAFASILQRLWDQHHQKLELHLILCGSALGTLGSLGDSGQPLHGRLGLKLKLAPFRFAQATHFAPDWSPQQHMRMYAAFGGIARNLAELRPARTLSKNILEAIMDPLGPLHQAPVDMLRAERLRDRAEAGSVLYAIANGENRFGAIAARTGLLPSRVDGALKELSALEMVERQVRFGDKPGARFARYRCTDPFVRFWFRLVQPNLSAVRSSSSERVWRERIAQRFEVHMGTVFEDIVHQAIMDGALEDSIGPVDRVAPFWSRDGKTEIDWVIGAGEQLVFVECKWRPDSLVGLDALQQLRDHVSRFSDRKAAAQGRLCLASAGRFDERLLALAETCEILLLGLDRLAA